MKYIFILFLVLSMMLSACDNKPPENKQQSLMDASKQELATALTERDQLLSLVKDIATCMDQIKHLEGIMSISGSQNVENSPKRAQLLSDIAAVKDTLQSRRKMLTMLEANIQKSTLYTDELKSTIEALRNQIDSQTKDIESLKSKLSKANEQIDQLNYEVDSLNITVATVNQNLSDAEATSLKLDNALNTCYYIAAPKSLLKEHKIVETGFLRKSKLLNGDFDKSVFVTADKRTIKTIELHSYKAKVYTNHPEGSYEIIDNNGQKVLTILYPEKFWSLTNYLVIQTD